MEITDAQELARARLAYVSAGQRPLSAPRRALPEMAAAEPVEASPPPQSGPVEPRSRPVRRLTIKHAVVVAVLVLCGVGVAVAALGRSSATEVPITPLVAQPSGSASPTVPVQVRVHVVGAVTHPGVVTLHEGAIVEDAIQAAGGLLPGADPALLNLAAPVSDGMQVAIGTADEPLGEVVSQGSGGASSGGLLNLNSATAAELEALPGVGPVIAQAIVTWREEHGRFNAVEELQEISGIGPKTFQKLSPMVRVS